MPPRSLLAVAAGAVVAIGCLAGLPRAAASKCFYSRATTCNRRCVPARPYALYSERSTASVVAVASVDQPTPITQYLPGTQDGQDRKAVSVLRKDFTVLDNSIVADGVALERMGFSLYSTGQYACTGMLRFDGGPDGSLLGANVVLRVRAYSGVAQHPGGLTNMRLLWETELPTWVHRGEAKSISLLPGPPQPACPPARLVHVGVTHSWPQPPSTLIEQHFDETTHLEIVLEHCKDR
jgi:hypothetical protein